MTTNNELPPAVRLMVQSGMIPQSAVRQLINWRLLPEDSEKLAGAQPVTLEGSWESVEKFIESLKEALVQEMETIRETELDRPGSFRDAYLYFEGAREGEATSGQVFVDRVGRVVTPASDNWKSLKGVKFIGRGLQQVVNSETRFEGDQPVAIVHYLEKEDPNVN